MNRSDVGFGLGIASGIISLLESSQFFINSISSVQTVAIVVGYLVGAGLAILVLFAASMVYKGRKAIGGIIMFVTSLSQPVNLILILVPGSIGIIPIFFFYLLPASGWLFFSMIGGILIISAEVRQERTRAISFSLFFGVLAFYATLFLFVAAISGTALSEIPGFYVALGVIPLSTAVLTFALFSMRRMNKTTIQKIETNPKA